VVPSAQTLLCFCQFLRQLDHKHAITRQPRCDPSRVTSRYQPRHDAFHATHTPDTSSHHLHTRKQVQSPQTPSSAMLCNSRCPSWVLAGPEPDRCHPQALSSRPHPDLGASPHCHWSITCTGCIMDDVGHVHVTAAVRHCTNQLQSVLRSCMKGVVHARVKKFGSR
jgi:hypothetical protein